MTDILWQYMACLGMLCCVALRCVALCCLPAVEVCPGILVFLFRRQTFLPFRSPQRIHSHRTQTSKNKDAINFVLILLTSDILLSGAVDYCHLRLFDRVPIRCVAITQHELDSCWSPSIDRQQTLPTSFSTSFTTTKTILQATASSYSAA
jgi:hypothetical protein